MRVSALTSAAVFGLSLVTGSSAYVVQLFSNDDCTGDMQEVNVWDNTCSTPGSFNSVLPKVYGGGGQSFTAYNSEACGTRPILGTFWADGGDSRFQIDQCMKLNSECYAMSSRAGGV